MKMTALNLLAGAILAACVTSACAQVDSGAAGAGAQASRPAAAAQTPALSQQGSALECRDQASTCRNTVGMEFVPVAAGSYQMGSDASVDGVQPDEMPRHTVAISRPFLIGRHEVTQGQWEAVMGQNPYVLDRSNPYYNLPGMARRITRPNHPATVSWEDAQGFIKKLNEREGHDRYRLPTEAEWEYAARAGTTTAFSFGDDAAQLGRYAWHGGNFATGATHPVGEKPANAWGLHDVHGNAWEWVQDWYAPDYYATSPQVDPRGPSSGAQKVVRGGSWHSTGNGWRSAFRRAYDVDYRGISIGFRVVMDVAASDAADRAAAQ
jgi:formylglycine-generating enzyme required for sulfatase activity